MASVNITITITDTPDYTLAFIRDTLMNAWGYSGDPADNAAKLAFAKAHIAKICKDDFTAWLVMAAQQADNTIETARIAAQKALIT